jgi:hypothetical protein
VLKATNGQVIGMSEMYSGNAAMGTGVASVKRNDFLSPSFTLPLYFRENRTALYRMPNNFLFNMPATTAAHYGPLSERGLRYAPQNILSVQCPIEGSSKRESELEILAIRLTQGLTGIPAD